MEDYDGFDPQRQRTALKHALARSIYYITGTHREGASSLSNFDIMDIIHSQGVDDFQGVFMKDQLPDKLERGSYVINLQSSKDGNGTHWVCLYYTPNFSYYYDSYGFIAPLEVQKKLFPICIMI